MPRVAQAYGRRGSSIGLKCGGTASLPARLRAATAVHPETDLNPRPRSETATRLGKLLTDVALRSDSFRQCACLAGWLTPYDRIGSTGDHPATHALVSQIVPSRPVGAKAPRRTPLHAIVRQRVEDAACKERETQGKESGQGRDWRSKGDRKGEKERRSRSKSTGGEEQREREGVIDGGRKATEKRGHKENERGRRMIGQAERKGRSAGKTEAVYADRRPSAVTARSD